MENMPSTKKETRSSRWESRCPESLCRHAGLRVLDSACRQACNAALLAKVSPHLAQPDVSAAVASAFKAESVRPETSVRRRSGASTLRGLFGRDDIARIVERTSGVIISKPSILLDIGSQIESAILADLSPGRIRQIVCQTLDSYIPPTRRQRGAKSEASEAATVDQPTKKSSGPPV